jgi:hypothetical protein
MKIETQVEKFQFSASWIVGESDCEDLSRMHKSPFRFSAEFAEHKVYNVGKH